MVKMFLEPLSSSLIELSPALDLFVISCTILLYFIHNCCPSSLSLYPFPPHKYTHIDGYNPAITTTTRTNRQPASVACKIYTKYKSFATL